MGIAFQANAFQSGYPVNHAFQGFDRYIENHFYSCLPLLDIVLYVNGRREVNKYAEGAVLVFQARVFDPTEIPSLPFDPTSVKLTVLNPDGTTLLNQVTMSKVSTGVYEYTYQTSTSNQTGVFQANFLGTSGGNTHQTLNQVAFELLVNS